jgi:hypothetical protein
MSENFKGPRGRMRLVVCDGAGVAVAERSAANIVLRQGATIIAGLFSGAAGSRPVDEVQVGFGREALDTGATSLTPRDVAAELLRSPVTADSFNIVADHPDMVQVSVSSVFHPTALLTDVTEAGLLAGGKLYNQVVFEPVTLRPGQDVTFFWEIDFPFGH